MQIGWKLYDLLTHILKDYFTGTVNCLSASDVTLKIVGNWNQNTPKPK